MIAAKTNAQDFRFDSLGEQAVSPIIKEQGVLIDDDPVYQALFKAVGNSMGISIKVFESLEEMVSFAYLDCYEFAIVDYHLEKLKGTEIAEYVDVFFPELPVFLVSADKSIDGMSFPSSIKKFFSKDSNPKAILREIVDTVEKLKYNDLPALGC